MNAPRAIVWVASLALGLLVPLLFASNAHAYPWMIRHGYTGCATCHTDPSGGAGALTAYGRAQGDLLLRMRYGATAEEADKSSGFLFGAVDFLPEALRFGGDFREAELSSQAQNAPLLQKLITMRADVYGDVKVGRFRAFGSIGYAPTGALKASLTRAATDNVVSREHWLGVELDDEGAWLLRGGRIALPFGIRMIEHTLWARVATRTDFNDGQQYGLALAIAKGNFRGELMAIAGNLQVRPDDFRERGYAGYAEYAPMTNLAIGVSSLFTRATTDITYGVTNYRQSHGAFARWAPVPQVVLLAEADGVFQSLTWQGHRDGYAGFVQMDYEAVQGFHVMLTTEALNSGQSGEPPSGAAWFSSVWFFAPHMDLRLDTNFTSEGVAATSTTRSSYVNVTTWLAQFHAYL